MSLINQSVAQQFDYRWRPVDQVRQSSIPKTILPWLTTEQSITAKLRHAGTLTVELLEERWQTPSPRERLRLALKPRELARIRTVILRVDGIAVVYARTIIPARSLKGSWRFLPYLGHRPLGGYVYKSRTTQRSKTEITRLPAGLLSHCDQAMWARRSIFSKYGPGVLVNEAFYPSISELTQAAGQL